MRRRRIKTVNARRKVFRPSLSVAAMLERADSWHESYREKNGKEFRPAAFRVARFVLPLEAAPTLNSYSSMHIGERQRIKKLALGMMRVQNGRTEAETLEGRPIVTAIRFSTVEPDRDAGWPKIPVDRLTNKNGGLGFLRDDRPKDLDLRYWWERAKRSEGFVYLEVWTDEESNA